MELLFVIVGDIWCWSSSLGCLWGMDVSKLFLNWRKIAVLRQFWIISVFIKDIFNCALFRPLGRASYSVFIIHAAVLRYVTKFLIFLSSFLNFELFFRIIMGASRVPLYISYFGMVSILLEITTIQLSIWKTVPIDTSYLLRNDHLMAIWLFTLFANRVTGLHATKTIFQLDCKER